MYSGCRSDLAPSLLASTSALLPALLRHLPGPPRPGKSHRKCDGAAARRRQGATPSPQVLDAGRGAEERVPGEEPALAPGGERQSVSRREGDLASQAGGRRGGRPHPWR